MIHWLVRVMAMMHATENPAGANGAANAIIGNYNAWAVFLKDEVVRY